MRQRVEVDASLSIPELMAMGMSRATAYKARKRGWYYNEYHHREVVIDKEKFDHDVAYIAARTIWDKHIYQQIVKREEAKRLSRYTRRQIKYDYLQEAVTRCLELSGKKIDKETPYSFYCQIAHNTMRNMLKKRDKMRCISMHRMEEACLI